MSVRSGVVLCLLAMLARCMQVRWDGYPLYSALDERVMKDG